MRAGCGAIFEAVDTCDAFIVIMTLESYEREWVEKEYLRAAEQKKPSFPLLLDGKVFPFFVGIQYYDVRAGKLPEQNFLERLAKFTSQRAASGQDVAVALQQQAKTQFDTSKIEQAKQDVPLQKPRRGSLVLAGAALILVAVIAVALIATRIGDGTIITLTPTPRVSALPSATVPAFVAEQTNTPPLTFMPSTTPTATFTSTAVPNECTYTIHAGDTFAAIATRFGVSVSTILQENNLNDPNHSFIGQVLMIPGCLPPLTFMPSATPTATFTLTAVPNECTYTIRAGDTFAAIATRFGVSVSTILQENNLNDPNHSFIGQVLMIPGCSLP